MVEQCKKRAFLTLAILIAVMKGYSLQMKYFQEPTSNSNLYTL